MFLSLVIPAYNESRRILPTLNKVTEYLSRRSYSWEVLVADDGSLDGTADLVEEFSRSRSQVSVLRLEHQGKGGAVRSGMLKVQGEYRFLCDADLSMPIEQLGRFLPPELERCDVAIGSREAQGAHRFDEPFLRHFQGRVYNSVVRIVAVPGFSDTQCGFKCFRGEVASNIFPSVSRKGFGFDVEVLYLALRLGFRVVEVPIDWYYGRESKLKPWRDSWAMALDCLSVRWNAIKGRYPARGRVSRGDDPGPAIRGDKAKDRRDERR